MADRKTFPGITPDAFLSDADRWALDKLKKVPLFPTVIRKFYDLGFDRWFYLANMGMSVRCGPKQYSKLYSILQESCRVLDMPEPELYLSCNPMPNAFTGGVERPFITVYSSMINTLNDEQLYFLMGHELGHIKAEHVLYFNVGAVLFVLLFSLGQMTIGVSDLAAKALLIAYYEWVRQAEFSADRCGLLVSQSITDSVDSLISFTAGPNRMSDDLNRDAFMEQARAYQNADPLDHLGKVLLFYMNNWKLTHPFPVSRVQELDKWNAGGALERILAGDYPRFRAEGAA
jgi:Zn-dependent protease with chaperone function